MKYNWPLVRKTFVVGLLLTGLDVFLVVSRLWLEGGELWLLMVIGPFLLVSSCLLAFAYLLLAHHSTSHLPEDWDQLSLEAKRAFAEERLEEKGNRFVLWLMRFDKWRGD